MAQLTYRFNLSAKSFPLIAKYWGQTVIVPQYDNTFNRSVASDADADKDTGIPQIYYCHNVFPNAQGFQSVGYTMVSDVAPGNYIFSKLIDISGISIQQVWLGVNDDASATYVYEYGGWVTKARTVDVTKKITEANVNGRAFVYAAGQGAWEYALDTRAFNSIAFTGVVPEMIDGICASFGYNILWTKQIDATVGTVDTNTTVDLSNFIPSVTALGLLPGMPIQGTNIPANTTIISINYGANTAVISNAATGTTANGAVNTPTVPSQVLWSSTIDPTDFAPSLITGAGGGAVEEAKGGITRCLPHNLGFFIFTTANIVVAVYTNNARYPFAFREIVNSGGITDMDRITYDANTSSLYVYNSSGLQVISTSQAQTVLPELTDFFSGNVFEDFNTTTYQFEYTDINDDMRLKLTIVADRYLVVSYGLTSFTHALVYDVSQKRFGKLKVDHVQCFEDFAQSSVTVNTPLNSVCFLTKYGKVLKLNFDYRNSASAGVILLGKYQFVRSRLLRIDEVKLENIEEGANTVVGVIPSLDGKTLGSLATGYLKTNSNGFRQYLHNSVGINHTVLLSGGFNLTSGELVFHVDGKV